MKKVYLIVTFLISLIGFSQNGISYQALIINPSGEQLPGVNNTNAPLSNKLICLKFSILDSNSNLEYIETHKITTDAYGIVNLIIGTGNQIGGYASTFSNILWNNTAKNLKVDLDVHANCTYYVEISNQPFTYVPFAYYAANAHVDEATTISTGLIQLAGDLGGPGTTATVPIISNSAITSAKILNGAVTPIKIAAGGNNTVLVTDDSGTVAWIDSTSFGAVADMTTIEGEGTTASPFKVKDLGIITAKLADGAVTNAKLAADAVTTDKILDGEVQTADIKDLNVTTAKINDAAVTTTKIASGGNNKVLVTDNTGVVAWLDATAFGAVADMISIEGEGTTASPFKVKDLGIITAKLADGAVTNAKLAADAVTTDKILDGEVQTADIKDLNVTTAKINDAAVTTTKIASGGTNKVLVTDNTGVVAWLDATAFGAVADMISIEGEGTTASPFKVKDLGIITAKLADGAVTNAKLAADAVTTDKILDGEVQTADIKDLNVTTAKINDAAVTTTKIASGGNNKVLVTDNTGVVAWLDATAFGAVADMITIEGAGTEANPFKVKDLGIVTNKLANASVTPNKIAPGVNNTVLVTDFMGNVAWIDSGSFGAVADMTTIEGAGTTASPFKVKDLGIITQKLANNAVTTPKIANAAVTTTKIASGGANKVLVTDNTGVVAWIDGTAFGAVADMSTIEGAGTAISPFKVKNLGIITAKLADGAVTTVKIADLNVTTSKIADANVTNAKLADLNVTTNKLANAAVTTTKIASGGNNKVLVTDNTGVVAWLDASAFGAVADMTTIEGAGTSASPFKVKDLGIITDKLANLAVTNAKLAENAVTTNKILDGEVQTADIKDLNVTTAKINDAAVTTTKIASGGNNKVLVTDNTGVVAWLDATAFGAVADMSTIEGAGTTASPFKVKDLGIITDKLANLAVTNAKLAENAVTTNKILDGEVQTADIKNLNVTTAKINDAAVTTTKIASGGNNKVLVTDNTGVVAWLDATAFGAVADMSTIEGAGTTASPFKVKDLGIVTNKLANLAVTNAKLAENAVTSDKILDGEVKTADIKNLNVTTEKINDAAVITTKIAAGDTNTVLVTDEFGVVAWLNSASFGAVADMTTIEGAGTTASPFKVKDLGIITDKLANLAVTNEKLAANAVTTDKILDGEVQTADIKDLNVTTAKINDAAVTTTKIASGGNNKVLVTDNNGVVAWLDATAFGAVADMSTIEGAGTLLSPFKVKDLGIITDKLADGAVTNEKLAENAVTTDKIADGEVQTADIKDLNVTTAKINDAAVTTTKIASGGNNKVLVTDASGNVAWINATAFGAVADMTTIEGAGTTASPFKVKDLGIVTNKLANASVTPNKIASGADNTVLVTDDSGNVAWLEATAFGAVADMSTIEGAGTSASPFKVKNLGIITEKLANNAVTSPKILDGTIIVNDLANDAVETAKIKNLNVTTNKLADDAVTTSKILNGTILNVDIADDTITTDKIAGQIAVSEGGTGSDMSSTIGYVIQDTQGANFTTVTEIPVGHVDGAVRKVNGVLPNTNGEVTINWGTVYSGTIANIATVVPNPANGDTYVIAGDSSTNNGRTFIYDGSTWLEVTPNQAALDARYLRLTGDTMQGDIIIPSSNKISISDLPTNPTDATNKAYVDAQIASGAPDATSAVNGKIRLAGDLAGTGSTAAAPVITNNAITTSKLADNAVTTDKILDGEVQTADIKDLNVTTAKINNAAVTTTKIASGADNTVLVTDASGNVAWLNSASFGAVADMTTIEGAGTTASPFKVKDLGIITAKLVDGAVTNVKLAADAVTTDKIKDGEVQTADIKDLNVTTAKINDAAVTTTKIASGGNNKVLVTDASGNVAWINATAFGAVADMITIEGAGTTASPFKVIDLSIVTNKLANLAVTNAKLAENAVTSDKILDGEVQTADIKDLNVTTAKINDAAVTTTKIASGADNTVLVTDASGNVAWLEATAFGAVADMITIEGAGTEASPFKVIDLSIVTNKLANLAVTNEKLAANAVTTDKILDGEVQTADIKDLNVTTAKINDAAVTTTKIASGGTNKVLVTDNTGVVAWLDKTSFGAIADMVTIEGAGTTASPFKVKDLGIITAKLADDAVTNAKLAENAVTTDKILDGEVQTADIKDLNVTTAKINDAAVTTTKIASGGNNKVLVTDNTGVVAWLDATAFGAVADMITIEGAGTTASPFKVIDLSIVTNKLADLAVTNEKLAENAVTSDKIVDGEVQTADIKDLNVTTAKINNAAVTTTKIASGADNTVLVTDASGNVAWLEANAFGAVADMATIEGLGTSASPFKVKDLGIITAKLADGAVNNDKLDADAVTTDKIKDGEVQTADIKDLNVTTAKINDAAVTTAKLADANVTTDKLANASVTTSKIAAGDTSTVLVTDALGNVAWLDSDSFGAVADQVTIEGEGTTASKFKVKDSGISTVKLADEAVTSPKILDGTIIVDDLANDAVETSKIKDLNVTTDKLANDAVTTGKILNETILNEDIADNTITTHKIAGQIAVSEGGTGSNMSSTSGYVKQATNGANFTTVTKIPVGDVDGAVIKVNGASPDANGNVTVNFGTVTTGILSNIPLVTTQGLVNGDIYVVSGDSNPDNNGLTFIFNDDPADWLEVTPNQAALDARYLRLAGDTMQGNIIIPATKKITITDAPATATDAVNKAYVDAQIASGAPDATTDLKGKIQLGGDLAGTGTTAAAPIITDNAITTNKINPDAVTTDKILNGTIISADLADAIITNAKLAETITVPNGGTGATTLTGYVKGNGTSAMTAVATIPVDDIVGAQTTANLASNITANTGSTTLYPSVAAVEAFVANSATPDATTTSKGKIKLAGDLAGTADLPTVPGLALKAPLASPALTGEPTAPTAAAGTSTTQIATTAFVTAASGTPFYKTGTTTDVLSDKTVNFYTNKRLGIGTNNPVNNLDVVGGFYLRSTAGNGGTGYGMEFMTDTNNPRLDWVANGAYIGQFSSNATDFFIKNTLNNSGRIRFYTRTGAADVERLMITNDGNVGIGTNTPNEKFVVVGNIKADKFIKIGGLVSEFLKADGSVDTIAYAPLASPTFTGVPAGPTATAGTNSTQLATTAFVATAVAAATIADATATTKGKIQLAGDLGGTAAAPLVAKLQGTAVSATAPTTNQLLQYDGTSWKPVSKSAIVTMETEEFTPTASQTSFTLTNTPLGKIAMYINGVRVPKAAVSVSGTTVTYVPASNSAYAILVTDRVSFDYIY